MAVRPGGPGRPLEGGKKESWPKRISYFARSVWYLFLLWVVLAALAGADEEGGSREEDRATARVLDWPLGRWIVGAVGLGILGAGVFNYWRGITASFKKNLKLRKMSEVEEKVFTVIGMVGHIARGTVFGLVGFFLVRAAWLSTTRRKPSGSTGRWRRSCARTTATRCSGSSRPG